MGEAASQEAVIQVNQPTLESAHLEEAVTMVEDPDMDTAGASVMLDTALVLASTSSPSQRLAEDAVLEFDATHRLSQLSMAWEILAAGIASFGEKL